MHINKEILLSKQINMKLKKIVFIVALVIAAITVIIGFFGLADIIQWLIHFPDSFTYWTFNNRLWLITLGAISFVVSLVLNYKYKYIRKWLMISFSIAYIGLFMSGFIAPTYIMFKSQHYEADYLPINKIDKEYLTEDDEVLVLVVNGDARAYPNKWIVQPHIAGDHIGGKDVVMTYCGLSHVGQAYSSNIDGQELNLKVMTQLKNNLVMFDANSQEPITQVYGDMQNSKRSLKHIPTTVMPYSSFIKLYSEGKVFHYYHKNFIDKLVYKMLVAVIYGEGGQYDKTTDELSFPSISHNDERLHAKEQVYGVNLNDIAVAFTKDYIIRNGGVVTETIGGDEITLKYFEDYDFVNIFYGTVPEVDPYGFSNGVNYPSVNHFNKILWKVWANYYRNTQVRK